VCWGDDVVHQGITSLSQKLSQPGVDSRIFVLSIVGRKVRKAQIRGDLCLIGHGSVVTQRSFSSLILEVANNTSGVGNKQQVVKRTAQRKHDAAKCCFVFQTVGRW